MDLNWARSLFTIMAFISFMLILWIVFSKRNKANYEDAANSILHDPDTPTSDSVAPSSRENGA